MRSAFAVVIAESDHAVPDHVKTFLRGATAPGLAFPTRAHAFWTSADSRVQIGAWQELDPVASGTTRWRSDPTHFAMTTGTVRRVGTPWGPENTWVDTFVSVAGSGDAPTSVGDVLEGIFHGLLFGGDGAGVIVADPLGLAFLFRADCPGFTVIASHPSLAAWAATPQATPPTRDVWASCLLSFSRIRLGDRTGYEAVRSLPVGTAVFVDPFGGARTESTLYPWLPAPEVAECDTESLVEEAAMALGESVRAALTYPAGQVVADLTGGKDSRVVLAAIVSEGLIEEYLFRTDGPPRMLDAGIASELAELMGLRHERKVESGDYGMTHLQRLEHFVLTTAGMNNIWSLKTYVAPEESLVRLSGLFGEALRSKIRRPLDSAEEAARIWVDRFGELGLIRADLISEYTEFATESVLAAGSPDARPRDLADGFRLSNPVRNAFGPREDHTSTPRLFPLSRIEVVRAAFAMGPEARNVELLHRRLMERASSLLATTRFADDGWPTPPRPREAWPPFPARDDEVRTQRPLKSASSPEADNYRQLIERSADPTRHAVGEILSDRTSDAWEILDRSVALDAFDRYDTLGSRERQELLGAATAVLWLGTSDS